MNQKQQKNNKILWGIIGIIFLAIGAFIIYKMVQANKDKKISSNQKPAENNDKPSQTSPPPTDLPTPSQEEELEKYLLEKRLDLKKYFVFNLQKEVKTNQQENTNSSNLRFIAGTLSRDFDKLTAFYEKEAKRQGYGIHGPNYSKQLISFMGNNFFNDFDDDFKGDNLDKKIANGEEWFIFFEKGDGFDKAYFGGGDKIDESGKRFLGRSNVVFVRTKVSSSKICKNKSEALEFLKNNDPALIE